MPSPKPVDSYIIDTFKQEGSYHPGAILYSGRKKLETKQWKEESFPTQQEADDFVRRQFIEMNIPEAQNEGELKSNAK